MTKVEIALEKQGAVMKEAGLLDQYFALIDQEGLVPSRKHDNFRFYLDQYLFRDISFDNKTVLEIGAGTGLYSFYAACLGADKIICLEPEAAGSTAGVAKKFRRLQSGLHLSDQVRLEPTIIQDFETNEQFDIILLYNSINHLEEEACANLQWDSQAVKVYESIFRKMGNWANKGAKLIIADCSRYNLFARLNLGNPFAPSVEWHKHQSPRYWAQLLSAVGFCKPGVRWRSWKAYSQLRSVGIFLFDNRFAAYFLDSHFCLTMEKE